VLVVLASPAIEPGTERELDSSPVTLGRASENDLVLDADEFASVHHARIEPRRDGVWLEDLESTNGTFVNGIKLSRPQKLAAGDVIRVGETDLRYEL
jgi:pSer/pThr/pTyr-binding forkhead associated (FHA) protein